MGRFSQAISEGDGISIVPVLDAEVAAVAMRAEEAGAEAIAVSTREAQEARAATSLPLIVDGGIYDRRDVERLEPLGADGWILVVDGDRDKEERMDELIPIALGLGVDCAIEVWDAENLADVLARFDPEILVIAHPRPDNAEDELEYILDLLPDVPAGKLVIARLRSDMLPEQVIALERAGVDAVLVGAEVFSDVLAELTGR
jgi:indole-3-glycerol phosphate synthase